MEAFLQTLLTMSATAAVVALVVMVLRLPLKKVPRWVTCALWGVVLLRMVLPAGLSLPVSLVPQGVSSGAYVERVLPAAPMTENEGNTVLADPAPQTEATPQTPVQQATVPDTAPEESSAAPRWPAVVTGIWAAGCGVCLLWAALSYWRLRRQVAEAVRVEPGVYETDQIPSPFVCGFFRPRIYLPAGLDVADRTYVLLHEKAHLRRWDHRTKVLAWLALSVHWFNPVLWLAYRLFCRDVEAACDQAVIRTFGREDTARYAEALLHLGRRTPLPAVLPLAFGEEDAKHRIRGVLTYKKPAFWLVLAAAAACVVAAVLLLSDRNPTEPQLDGEPVTGGQVVQVLELDAPWTASPTATTTVPLPEEMVAEVVGLLEEGVVQPFSTSILPDPLPDWTVILTTTQATYYACFAGTSDPGLYRVDPSGDCTWSNLYSAPLSALIDWHAEALSYIAQDRAQDLYQYRTPYIGNASDTGAVVAALGIAQVLGDYTIELQTTTEPYGLTLRFPQVPHAPWVDLYLRQMGRLVLALIDNAGTFSVAIGTGEPFPYASKTLDPSLNQPEETAFQALYTDVQSHLTPYTPAENNGWCYQVKEYLYFDPDRIEFPTGSADTRREQYQDLRISTTQNSPFYLWVGSKGVGCGEARFSSQENAALSPPLSPIVTTPDGQVFDFSPQEGEQGTVLALAYHSSPWDDTGYRIYLQGDQVYLAYFREGVLGYLAQLGYMVYL